MGLLVHVLTTESVSHLHYNTDKVLLFLPILSFSPTPYLNCMCFRARTGAQFGDVCGAGRSWVNASEHGVIFSCCISVSEPIPSWNEKSPVRGQNEDVEA